MSDDAPELRIGAATHIARLAAPAEGWRSFAADLLGRLDRELQRFAPDWLGHCKLLVETADAVAYASLTESGGAPGWSAGAPDAPWAPAPAEAGSVADLTIYCAAYGLDDNDAAAALAAVVAAFPRLAA